MKWIMTLSLSFIGTIVKGLQWSSDIVVEVAQGISMKSVLLEEKRTIIKRWIVLTVDTYPPEALLPAS